MGAANKLLQAASGGAKGDPVYVDDVFSTNLWAGDGSSETITNGIDFSGEGGMVWFARRTTTDLHTIIDTERGGSNAVFSTSTSANYNNSNMITSFNSNGFAVGSYAGVNDNNEDLVGWSFRKQAGFFDVQTWTGNGSAADIAHDLGCVPAFVMYKRTDSADDWKCYHVGTDSSSPQSYFLELNSSNARQGASGEFSAAPTATHLKLNSGLHGNGASYVAYIFAGTGDSDSQIFGDDSDEAIIKCGSYTTDGSGNATVDLGFEPQWVLDKTSNYSANWSIVDFMRGFDTLQSNGYDQAAVLYANVNNAESLSGGEARITPTGFTVTGTTANQPFIYVAIRRPMKAPEYGTDVFSPYGYSDTGLTSGSGTATNRTIINGGSNGGSGFPVDVFMHKTRTTSSYGFHVFDRLRGKGRSLLTNSTAGEPAGDGASNGGFAFQEGVDVEYNGEMYYYTSGAGGRSHITYHLRRATGFMDVVAYTGNSTAGRQITHNLKTVPNMIIIKNRGAGEPWYVYHEGTDSSAPEDYHTLLNSTAARVDSVEMMNDTAPTASVFSVSQYNSVNGSGKTYIAYLFATLAGVSKVGTYTGSGSSQTINCGFSSSARLVLIKKTSSTGNWLVFDSVRGISVGATDGTLTLDTNTQDYTEQVFFSNDVIQPDNTGFKVLSTASLINSSGADYIFLAIA